MKLVLSENIRGLGRTGDVVEVKDGYARNYLLPKKLAMKPTEGNVQRLRKERETYLLREKSNIESSRLIAEKLNGVTLQVQMKANEAGMLFGSVTEQIVADKLAELLETEIRPQQVILGSHFKRIGEYLCAVRLHSEVEVELPLVVSAEPTEEELEEAQAAAEAAAAAEAGEGSEEEEGAEPASENTEAEPAKPAEA
ncbi:MAG TPA: 50S ribosomal protein L9 [Planctomycetes bacterium]|nr:50S ribosomal protein L9 [Planctomycetota bacterium]